MIFWKTNNLAELLVNSRLTERQKIHYYLATLYLQLVGFAVPAYFWGTKIDELGLVSFVMCAVVATYSVLKIFNINKGIDGKNIIERLVVLSFPAFLKATMLYWVLVFVNLLIYALTENTTIFGFLSFVIMPFYYWFGLELIAIALKKQCITSH